MSSSLFADITSNKKRNLKKTSTKVTQRDGKVYVATKSDDGALKEEYKETVDISNYLQKKELTKEEIKQHDEFVQSFDIEQWYKDLKSVTFDTYFIPLSIENAELITKLFTDFHGDKDKTNEWILNQINENQGLNTLCDKINEIITTNKMNGCFSKLSSRSPKDSTNEKLSEIFNKKIKELKDKPSLNDCVNILFESGFESMKCMDAQQCLLNIIKSKRCYEDLVIALKYKDNQFIQNVIIRPWIDIESKNEFRAFVYDNKFVAMSQYNYTVKYDDIINNKDNIYQIINSFWKNKCHDILSEKYDKYIIDFAIVDKKRDNNDDKEKKETEDESQDVIVIELNPYENDTDSLLFEWKSKKDQMILTGKADFEFRVQCKEFDQDDIWRLLPSHKVLVQSALK